MVLAGWLLEDTEAAESAAPKDTANTNASTMLVQPRDDPQEGCRRGPLALQVQ